MAEADYDGFGSGFSQGHGMSGDRAGRAQRYVNIAGAVTSVALVLGMAVWGYKLAVRDVSGVPVIQALDGPMRIAPEDPGGEIADNQGLAVNNVAEVGIAGPTPERLVLAPRPVELAEDDAAGLAGLPVPDVAPVAAPGEPVAGDPDLALAAAPLVESASPTEIAVDAALAEALGEDYPAAEELVEDEPAPEGAILTSIRPKARPVRGAAVTEAPAEATSLPAPNEVDPATIAAGTRLVQFGAFDSVDEARAEWAKMQGRFGDLMAGKSLVVQPAERGGQTFYRLRALGFEDEDDARRFCTAFVAENATCIPVAHR